MCSGNVAPEHGIRRHHRGKRGKRAKTSKILNGKILYQNLRGIGNKICDINSLLDKLKPFCFAMSETHINQNTDLSNLHRSYEPFWNKKNDGSGGVGILVRRDIPLIDDERVKISVGDYERQWVTLRVGKENIALGVCYFPCDGRDKEKSSYLFNELNANISLFEAHDYKVILTGDFNGRLSSVRHSFNGKKVAEIVESNGLIVTNNLPVTKGKFTWFRGEQRSIIDYILCSGSFVLILTVW